MINGSPVEEPPVSDLVLSLAKDVTRTDDDPYPELQLALDYLISKINGTLHPDQDVDWPAIIAEALTLRRRH